MLNIVCVKWGTLYGADYVNILYDMVRRNIKDGTAGKFICFTDDPTGLHDDIETRDLPGNLTGWWNKLYLFKNGLFPNGDRILYLDLDTVITGSLDEILAYEGDFAILRDVYRPKNQMSAVMSWVAGECGDIWSEYVAVGFPSVEWGDQGWVEKCRPCADIWQDMYPDVFVSYKVHCRAGIPMGAKVVCFHGVPTPQDVIDGWVPKIWKVGGGSALEIVVEGNTKLEVLKENIRYSLSTGIKTLDGVVPAHSDHAVIVGGAPSINNHTDEIKNRAANGQHIIALNNSWRWLDKNEIKTDKHVLLDARAENAVFVPLGGATRIYATQCHPDVTNQADLLWHANIPDIVADFTIEEAPFWVGSGTTVGIRSVLLLYVLGYRHFHIYGYDSSYTDGKGHAYSQSLNDDENVIEVDCSGRTFKAAPWMVTQVNEFLQLMEMLTGEGCEFSIHGDGLLQHAIKTMLIPAEIGNQQGDITEYSGMWWPTNDSKGRKYITSALGDVNAIMSFVNGQKVCVQAGGNVGLWPKQFAKYFEAVYTFEPDAVNFHCLNLNCPEKHIIKLQAALGCERGLVDLAHNTRNCGAHSIAGDGLIPTLKIDDLGLTACDLIQLDIEGYELNALKGAVNTIVSFFPVIVVEENGLNEKYNAKEGDIADFLSGFGYREVARFHRDIVFCYNN